MSVQRLPAMPAAPSRSRPRAASRPRHRRAPARREHLVPRRRPGSAANVLRGVAAATVVSGWIAAGLVFGQSAVTPDADADAVEYAIVENHVYPITLEHSPRTRQLVQRLDGDLGLWIAEFDVGLRSLLRPPRLAWTLLVVTTAIGAVCLHLARLSAEDIED